MEIWQLWLSMGTILALLGVIIAICIRKHKDKHRIQALQKNLEDLELSFKHMSEEMDLVVNQNLKTMEEKCETMRELLVHADKKCLYADQLIAAIDKGTEILKERNLNVGNQIIAPGLASSIDSETLNNFEMELQKLDRRVGFINDHINELEKSIEAASAPEKTVNSIGSQEIADLRNDVTGLKHELDVVRKSVSEKVTNEIAKQLSVLDTGFSEIATEAIKIDNTRNSNNNVGKTEVINGDNILQFSPKMPHNVKPLSPKTHYLPEGKELVVKSIMELYEQGISTPQIASELNMSRGEIDLIIKKNTGKLAARG